MIGVSLKANYVDHLGDDLRVVNSARVSFNKESTSDKDNLSTQDQRLINYLARNGHWTPFSHPQITMREKVPIFVARQRFKHMVGFTYNEVSRRYVDDTPEYYTPDEWRERPEDSIKQGSGGLVEDQEGVNEVYRTVINRMHLAYNKLIMEGVAPEQARMILPQSMYTEYYVTGSLAAWARAYKQRIDTHSQKEIQELAQQWDNIISPLFPVSWKAITQQDS